MNLNQCPQCGGPVLQDGADMTNVYYLCSACGSMTTVPIGEDSNGEVVYAPKKREILNRLRAGCLDWRVTQWDRLYMELNDFITRYELAQQDIQIQMGLVACITRGFNMMDADRVKQCQNLFKMTEKMYKAHLKSLKKQMNPKLYETVSEYKEVRAKYKRCLNQYRNTKLAWKLLFTVAKKFVPMGLGF